MKAISSVLTAVALALLLRSPALAAREAQDDTVTVTFDLTLYGDVPGDATFGVLVDLEDEGAEDLVVVHCGQPAGYEAKEDCEGGDGTTYTERVELARGARIFYLYAKVQPESEAECEGEECPDGLQQNFYATATELGQASGEEDFQTIDADATKAAYYDADAGEGGGGGGPGSPAMPDTGAGGGAGDPFPFGPTGAALSVLAVCVYLLRRRLIGDSQ